MRQEENSNGYTNCTILFIRMFVYLDSIEDSIAPRSEETTKA
jgi:hypothetical protein